MNRAFLTLSAIGVGLLLGVVYVQLENRASTTPTFPTDTEIAEMTVEELFQQGEYYFNHDDDPAGPYDIELARAYYEAAIKKDPQAIAAIWYQLGRIDFIEGKFDAALYKFGRVEEYFPDSNINPNYMVGLVYGYRARQTQSSADWKAAEAAFIEYIEYEPYAPWPRVDLAWIYFAEGKFEEMKPVLAQGLVYDPNNAWLHNMYGLAMLNTGETEVAREHFGFAKTLAGSLTAEDWGQSYPGNNPTDWAQGLREFQAAIDKNIALTEVSDPTSKTTIQ